MSHVLLDFFLLLKLSFPFVIAFPYFVRHLFCLYNKGTKPKGEITMPLDDVLTSPGKPLRLSGAFSYAGRNSCSPAGDKYEPCVGRLLCRRVKRCVRQHPAARVLRPERNCADGLKSVSVSNETRRRRVLTIKKRPTGQSLISLFFHYRSFIF